MVADGQLLGSPPEEHLGHQEVTARAYQRHLLEAFEFNIVEDRGCQQPVLLVELKVGTGRLPHVLKGNILVGLHDLLIEEPCYSAHLLYEYWTGLQLYRCCASYGH